MGKDKPSYLEQVMEDFCEKHEPITGPVKPREGFADEDRTATVLIDEETLERLKAEKIQEEAADANTFAEQNPTAVMDDDTFRRLRIKEIREELKGEIELISDFAKDKRYDTEILQGLLEMHTAYAYYERGLIPYSPKDILDDSVAGKNIDTELNQLKAMGCSIDWLIKRMTEDQTYRRNVRHIYEKVLPKTDWFKGLKKGSKPQK
jgi:leucyl-tRNA synthetase